VSTLQYVGPDEFRDGLGRFRAAHPDPSELVRYRVEYRAVWGRVEG